VGGHLLRLIKFFQDFLAGLTSFEIEQTARQEKISRQDLFLLIIFGNILGLPIFSSYYSLRLMPYIYPAIPGWAKRMLREVDFTEIKTL
jgi:hypothetical protein